MSSDAEHVLCLCSGAEPERVKREIEEVVGLDTSNALLASAKEVQSSCQVAAQFLGSIPSRLHILSPGRAVQPS